MSALPAVDVRHREQQARTQIASEDIDALIITSPTNIRWLTGFAGSNGAVVLTQNRLTLITDSRYQDRAPTELDSVASSAELVIERAEIAQAARTAVGGAVRVGLEADHVSWAHMQTIAADWLDGLTVVPTTQVLDELRARKDEAEVARIRAAANIVDAALAEVQDQLAAQLTERQFAQTLDAAIRGGGAEDLGFDTIVASGPNGAIPHHSPGDRVIVPGDLVIIDVGAKVDGYRSDMTRTFCVGPMSTDQRRHYDVVALSLIHI